MIITTVLLSLFGLVMVFSSSYYTAISKYSDPVYYLKSDLVWVIFGWGCFTFFAMFDYHRLQYFAIPVLFIGFVLLGLIFTPMGKTLNNATRWLDFKFFTVMPGEVIKFCLIIFVAWFYAKNTQIIKKFFKGIVPVALITGVAFFLIYKQPNLSTAGTVVLIVLFMMIVAGLHIGYVLLALVCCGGGVAALVLIKGNYMLDRIIGFWDPFSDPLGSGYQVVQSIYAFANGGVFGVGLGKSVQKALYLPEAMNDFILPIIGEELGFVGVACLMAVYIVLIWRMCRVSINSSDRFGALLAAGVAIHIAVQVIINFAVVTASFPPTGVVLPLISMGGTATLLIMGELGIVYNVSRQTKRLL